MVSVIFLPLVSVSNPGLMPELIVLSISQPLAFQLILVC